MKKLISILALTAVVANLGIATVFAQQTSDGTQIIECGNTPTMTAPRTLTFDAVPDDTGIPATLGIQNAKVSTSPQTTTAQQTGINITDNRATVAAGCASGDTDVVVTVKIDNANDNFCRRGDLPNTVATCEAGDLRLKNEANKYSALSFIGNGATTAVGAGYYNNSIDLSSGSHALSLDSEDIPTTAVELFRNANGFNGTAVLPALNYSLVIPENSPAGTFTATLTYELTF